MPLVLNRSYLTSPHIGIFKDKWAYFESNFLRNDSFVHIKKIFIFRTFLSNEFLETFYCDEEFYKEILILYSYSDVISD